MKCVFLTVLRTLVTCVMDVACSRSIMGTLAMSDAGMLYRVEAELQGGISHVKHGESAWT